MPRTITPIGYTTYYVPDPYTWEDTGVTVPAVTSVLRLGTKLYMFAGLVSGVNTNKIYSADWNGSTPSFVDTGATMPTATSRLRIALIGSKLYAFGDSLGSTAIWSADLATPTSWSSTGSSIDTTRINAALVVAGGRIWIPSGHNGSSYLTTIGSASTSTPTTWSTSSGSVVNGVSEAFACLRDDGMIIYGGGASGTSVSRWQQNSVPTATTGSNPNALIDMASTAPAVVDCGNEWALVGVANTKHVYTCTKGSELGTGAWQRAYNVLPGASQYNFTCWYGRPSDDGRAYIASSPAYKIYRSGRRAVAVPDSVIAASPSDAYRALPGVYADSGLPAIVPRSVRMGFPSWLTDRVTAF